MNTETLDQTTLFSAMDEAESQLLNLMSSLDENSINKIPYANSWTAAMLFSHITKSNSGIAKTLQVPTQPGERDIDARVTELKKILFDFSKKMDAPNFLVPEEAVYQKQDTMEKLAKSFKNLKESVQHANMADVVKDLPMGEITKLELLHFVLYHTQRHLHQLKKICDALNSK